jgi:hypothetical protein
MEKFLVQLLKSMLISDSDKIRKKIIMAYIQVIIDNKDTAILHVEIENWMDEIDKNIQAEDIFSFWCSKNGLSIDKCNWDWMNNE